MRQGISRRSVVGVVSAGALATGWVTDVRAQDVAGRARNLRVEWLSDPLGIDTRTPRFRWELTPGSGRDVKLGTARVLVARNEAALKAMRGDVWDSGSLSGRLDVQPAQPLDLVSHTPYWWAVQSGGQWSAPARFVTGLLDASEWQGLWIAAKSDPAKGQHVRGMNMVLSSPEDTVLPIFRKSFDLSATVSRAVVSVTGLGHYELTVNGAPVTDSLLNPGWTEYDRTIYYNTFDVTRLLKSGGNRLGVWLGNGMYNAERIKGRKTKFSHSYGAPKFSLHLSLFMADGSVRKIVTDQSWQVSEGPILFSSIFGGEDVDARRERPGWDRPDDNSADGWRPALEVPTPPGRLRAQPIPPVRQHQRFEAVKVTEPQPGVFVYDLGENFAGRPEVVVRGPAGAKVRIRRFETPGEDGMVWQRSFNAGAEKGWVEYNYTLAGRGEERFVPRFNYHGFRYLQIEGGAPAGKAGPDQAAIVSVAGQFCYTDLPLAGRFGCDNDLFVRIHRLIERAVLSNAYSVLTDCPHREKLGWLEQNQLNALTVFSNRDAVTMYEKMVHDINDTQKADGMVPGIAPEFMIFLKPDGTDTDARNSPEWGGAVALATWAAYRQYGDTRMLADGYAAMRRYADYLNSRAEDTIVDFGLGDWYDMAPDGKLGPSRLTSRALSGTATWYQVLETIAKVAKVLGRPAAEISAAQTRARTVRDAFNTRFFKAETGSYDRDSQTANAMPLALGMVPEGQEGRVLEALVRAVRASQNGVTAGDVGFYYVVQALMQAGRDDVLFDMMSVTDRPSYGYQLAKGATALTEAWNADPTKSLNHFMLGHGEGWLYGGIGGIHVDFADAGGRVITVAPKPVGTLSEADVSHHTVFGEVRSVWRRKGRSIQMEVDIPPGAQARIVVPHARAATESGRPVKGRIVAGGFEILTGSGRYRLSADQSA